MTDTWVADGANGPLYISWIDEENCQEAGIGPGASWWKRLLKGRDSDWKYFWLKWLKCHFYSSSSLHIHIPDLCLENVLWINWTPQYLKSSDIIHFFWACIFPGTDAFITHHILLHVMIIWPYVDMELHISIMNLIFLEWQRQPIRHPGYGE